MNWWTQPRWTETRCACGAKIWPEGDPDWGACFTCFSASLDQQAADRAAEDEHYCQMEAEHWRHVELQQMAELAEISP